jgi:hypothetical protein
LLHFIGEVLFPRTRNRPAKLEQQTEDKPMAANAAELLIDTISDWGVEVIFGLPGDGINGIMEALRQRAETDRLESVAARDLPIAWATRRAPWATRGTPAEQSANALTAGLPRGRIGAWQNC